MTAKKRFVLFGGVIVGLVLAITLARFRLSFCGVLRELPKDLTFRDCPKFIVASELSDLDLVVLKSDELWGLAQDLRVFDTNGVYAKGKDQDKKEVATVRAVVIKLLAKKTEFDHLLTNGVDDPALREERGIKLELSRGKKTLVVGIWLNPKLRGRLVEQGRQSAFVSEAVIRSLITATSFRRGELVSAIDGQVNSWLGILGVEDVKANGVVDLLPRGEK